jgi:hypothetical protein
MLRCRNLVDATGLGIAVETKNFDTHHQTEKNPMKPIEKILLISLLFLSPASAQLLEGPLFSFEQLSWGMKFADVSKALNRKELKPMNADGHSLPQGGSSNFIEYYLDTMYTQRVLVALQFAKEDSLLKSVIVTSMSIDTLSKQLHKNDDKIDRFRQKYSDRLGKADKEKSIPFMGRMSTWSFKATSVQMLEMSSISMLSFTFMPRSADD